MDRRGSFRRQVFSLTARWAAKSAAAASLHSTTAGHSTAGHTATTGHAAARHSTARHAFAFTFPVALAAHAALAFPVALALAFALAFALAASEAGLTALVAGSGLDAVLRFFPFREEDRRVQHDSIAFLQTFLDLGDLFVGLTQRDFTKLRMAIDHDEATAFLGHVHAADQPLQRDGQDGFRRGIDENRHNRVHTRLESLQLRVINGDVGLVNLDIGAEEIRLRCHR